MTTDIDLEWSELPEGRVHFGWTNALANLEADSVFCHEDASFRDACFDVAVAVAHYMQGGPYAAVEAAFDRQEDAGLALGEVEYVDEDGTVVYVGA